MNLIDFCKIYGIYIANGRIGNDKGIGNYTFIGTQGCSVIDYVIMSPHLFNITDYFDIEKQAESSHLPLVIMFNDHDPSPPHRSMILQYKQVMNRHLYLVENRPTLIHLYKILHICHKPMTFGL